MVRIETSPKEPRGFYPPIEPYDDGILEVGEGHRIYWERCGHPQGKPAVFLHGGPGGGCSTDNRRLFDPERYDVLLFDQRGCGRSRPRLSLVANTTWHLIEDIERLRRFVGVERWLVLGGSWGSTLALAYAQTHPTRVSALILRGIFTGRASEIRWFYQDGGASALFPDEWQRLVSIVPEDRHGDVIHAYRELLTSPERAVRLVAAKAWTRWERNLLTLLPNEINAMRILDEDDELALAEIEAHYFAHDCFMEEDHLLRNAARLEGIPNLILQGRYDVITPARTAWELHQAWRGSNLLIISNAGHGAGDPAMVHYLVSATDEFSDWI